MSRRLRLTPLVAVALAALAATRAVAGDAPPAPEIPAPEVVPSAPAVPTPDTVPGGDRVERVQVTDAYIEMRTFPGRDYPVFHVAARGEWISIELRHTDWYKVRTAGGKVGWVHRKQLESTLAEAGGQQTFRDVLLDDYLARRGELGAAYGRFHSEPMIKLFAGWRFSDTLGLQWTLGQVQGAFSGTTVWHFDLTAEPWSDRRLSPFAGIGIGRFHNIPNQSLVQFQATQARLADATIGAKFHLSDRFVLRADYTLYQAFVSDRRTIEYHAATAGVSFFF